MKIARIAVNSNNNNNSQKNRINFRSFHLLHLPSEYSGFTPVQLSKILTFSDSNYERLLAIKTQFINLVRENFKGDWDVLSTVKLNDGNLALLRITDADEAENVAFSADAVKSLQKIEKDSIHYIVGEDNKINIRA